MANGGSEAMSAPENELRFEISATATTTATVTATLTRNCHDMRSDA